jgi:iron complex transport system permease protein
LREIGGVKLALLISAFLALSFLLSLSVGAYRPVGIREVLGYLAGSELPASAKFVIEERLWRTLAAVVTGIGLSAAGATLQFVLKNPLADPYILGVAGGSGLAVLLAIAYNLTSPLVTYAVALIGGLAAFGLVLLFSSIAGSSPFSIVLSGVAVGYLTWAFSMLVMINNSEKIAGGMLWLFGTVAFSTRSEVVYSVTIVVVALVVLTLFGNRIGKLILGDEVAESLGVNVRATRVIAIVGAALATSAAVALSGPIGFVGLVAPWAAREAVGSRFLRFLATSAVIGAILLTFADVSIRAAFSPLEVPLTSIVAIVGVPVMIYIIKEMRRESV